MRISDWSSDVCSSDLSGTARQTFAIIAIGVNAIGAAVAHCAPIAHCGRSLSGARGSSDNAALRIERALADDINYAIDGIGPPQGATGNADNLNSVEVIQHRLSQVPENASMKRGGYGQDRKSTRL